MWRSLEWDDERARAGREDGEQKKRRRSRERRSGDDGLSRRPTSGD